MKNQEMQFKPIKGELVVYNHLVCYIYSVNGDMYGVLQPDGEIINTVLEHIKPFDSVLYSNGFQIKSKKAVYNDYYTKSKATPELLQQALRVLEIGLSPEISAKILATVRLLDEKGDNADLKDFALIEAAYSEKIEPEIINLANLEMCDTIELRNGDKLNISQVENNGGNLYRLWHLVGDFNEYIGWFFTDGVCESFNQNPANIERYDIVKIIKPTKPQ